MRTVQAIGILTAMLVCTFGCGSKDAAETKTQKPATAKTAPVSKAAPAAKKAAASSAARSWNFAQLQQDEWEWGFPNPPVAKVEDGARYFMAIKEQPGPQLHNVPVDAKAISQVRVTMSLAKDLGKGKTEPATFPRLDFFYGNRDTAKDPKWPFDVKDVARLQPVSGQKDVFQAKLDPAANWKGELKDFFVDVFVPELTKEEQAGGVKYAVTFTKIELLK